MISHLLLCLTQAQNHATPYLIRIYWPVFDQSFEELRPLPCSHPEISVHCTYILVKAGREEISVTSDVAPSDQKGVGAFRYGIHTNTCLGQIGKDNLDAYRKHAQDTLFSSEQPKQLLLQGLGPGRWVSVRYLPFSFGPSLEYGRFCLVMEVLKRSECADANHRRGDRLHPEAGCKRLIRNLMVAVDGIQAELSVCCA